MSKSSKRIEWIDYLKAFACILVVLGHLLQSLQKSGIDNNQKITSFINWFIYLFHMPIFFCLSGYLYEENKTNFSWKNYKRFEIKKIINLAIPYFSFYILFVIINMLFSSSVNNPKGIKELLNMFNNPMAPYWFLYALLSIFMVIPLVEKVCKENKHIILLFLLLLKVVSIFVKTNIYFLDSVFSNAIYFYIGNFIINKENSKNIKIKWYLKNILYITLYIILAYITYKNLEKINPYIYEIIKVGFAIFGIYICVNIFRNIKKLRILDTIKKYTFQIYLLHTIFAAGIRIVLIKIEVKSYIIHFFMGLMASIYLPVLVGYILQKIKFLNFFFYPVKTITDISANNSKSS